MILKIFTNIAKEFLVFFNSVKLAWGGAVWFVQWLSINNAKMSIIDYQSISWIGLKHWNCYWKRPYRIDSPNTIHNRHGKNRGKFGRKSRFFQNFVLKILFSKFCSQNYFLQSETFSGAIFQPNVSLLLFLLHWKRFGPKKFGFNFESKWTIMILNSR